MLEQGVDPEWDGEGSGVIRGRSNANSTASTYFGSVEEEVDSGRRRNAVDVDVSVDGGVTV